MYCCILFPTQVSGLVQTGPNLIRFDGFGNADLSRAVTIWHRRPDKKIREPLNNFAYTGEQLTGFPGAC